MSQIVIGRLVRLRLNNEKEYPANHNDAMFNFASSPHLWLVNDSALKEGQNGNNIWVQDSNSRFPKLSVLLPLDKRLVRARNSRRQPYGTRVEVDKQEFQSIRAREG